MPIDIKDKHSGKVIYTYNGYTLSNSDIQNANLEGADLSDLILRNANLSGANLRDADLSGTNLICVNFTNANLENANFKNSNLTGANLEGANLEGANFFNCLGNGKEIITVQTEFFNLNFRKSILNAGCATYTYDEWVNFTDDELYIIGKEDAVGFRKKYKDIVLTLKDMYNF
jgi:uncharacterized protein YjbI with pentapeptide repeats